MVSLSCIFKIHFETTFDKIKIIFEEQEMSCTLGLNDYNQCSICRGLGV